jgi:hypothetical protein
MIWASLNISHVPHTCLLLSLFDYSFHPLYILPPSSFYSSLHLPAGALLPAPRTGGCCGSRSAARCGWSVPSRGRHARAHACGRCMRCLWLPTACRVPNNAAGLPVHLGRGFLCSYWRIRLLIYALVLIFFFCASPPPISFYAFVLSIFCGFVFPPAYFFLSPVSLFSVCSLHGCAPVPCSCSPAAAARRLALWEVRARRQQQRAGPCAGCRGHAAGACRGGARGSRPAQHAQAARGAVSGWVGGNNLLVIRGMVALLLVSAVLSSSPFPMRLLLFCVLSCCPPLYFSCALLPSSVRPAAPGAMGTAAAPLPAAWAILRHACALRRTRRLAQRWVAGIWGSGWLVCICCGFRCFFFVRVFA